MKEVKKESFGAAVAVFKNVSEEEAVNLAGDKITRNWEKQIRTAKSNIEKSKTAFEEGAIEREQELKERQDAYYNSFLEVDATIVTTVDQRNAFVEKYELNVSRTSLALDAYIKFLNDGVKEQTDYLVKQLEIIDLYTKFIADRATAIAQALNK